MVKFYVAFDDTDTLNCGRGTGKLARWFMEDLPETISPWGVVRQQLLDAPEIPKTSHNSALCCVVETPDFSFREVLIELAIKHIKKHFILGSDPGLCVASELDPELSVLKDFGVACTASVNTQKEAIQAAGHCHLSGHGGTNDGIIGAAAAVGLTALGESGRLVAYRDIRELPGIILAADLRKRDIQPVSAQRHAEYIPDHHRVDTLGSLRPHLSGNRLTLPLFQKDVDLWQTFNHKKEEPGL